MLLAILVVNKRFYEKKLQKTNQKEFRIKKVIKKMTINSMSNRKVMIIHLIVGLIKKTLLYKMSYFQPYDHGKNKIEVEFDLSNYSTISDLKMKQVSIHRNLLKMFI